MIRIAYIIFCWLAINGNNLIFNKTLLDSKFVLFLMLNMTHWVCVVHKKQGKTSLIKNVTWGEGG